MLGIVGCHLNETFFVTPLGRKDQYLLSLFIAEPFLQQGPVFDRYRQENLIGDKPFFQVVLLYESFDKLLIFRLHIV